MSIASFAWRGRLQLLTSRNASETAKDLVVADKLHNHVKTLTQELQVIKRDCKNTKERLEGANATISFQAEQIKINEQHNAQNAMLLQRTLEEN